MKVDTQEPLASATVAAQQASYVQKMYDQTVRDWGEDSPMAKNLKEQLDTVYLKRSSPIAHLRNEKQVQDAILQFAQHLDKTQTAHAKVRDHEQANLKALEKM
eukprot:188892-Karenia_brevis.AAC.1